MAAQPTRGTEIITYHQNKKPGQATDGDGIKSAYARYTSLSRLRVVVGSLTQHHVPFIIHSATPLPHAASEKTVHIRKEPNAKRKEPDGTKSIGSTSHSEGEGYSSYRGSHEKYSQNACVPIPDSGSSLIIADHRCLRTPARLLV